MSNLVAIQPGLSPGELGLPEKFGTWRPNQETCINALIESPKRHSVISAPTGFGKTAVYIAYAIASGKRVCILVSTRGLADQLLQEFESLGIVDIRGRANYACDLKPDFSCEEGRAARCPYWNSVQCPYSLAETRVRLSKLVVTNYSKWMSARGSTSPLQGFDILICDEAHTAVESLAGAMQIQLQYHEIEEELKVPFLKGALADTMEGWKVWASAAFQVCCDRISEAAQKLQVPDPKTTHVKKYNHMINLQNRLSILSMATAKDWVCERFDWGWQFDPIRPAKYAELKLFCRIPRVVMVSATIRPKTMFMLNVAQERFDFLEYPSDFDISRCPTYHIPTMRNDHRATDFSVLYLRVDQIMGRRADRKGIIQTVSWKRRDEAISNSQFSGRMLVNPKGEAPTEAIEEFRKSKPPTVLVSPSVGTGYDFPYDQCEYQILLKIPFPDSRSKIVKARQEADPEYGAYQAMQDLVQIVGRPMRAKDDRAENFILDDHIAWFRGRFGHFAPRSFHKFFKEVGSVPPPPPKL